MTPEQHQLYREIAQRLDDAPFGEKSKMVDEVCGYLGLTRTALYRALNAVGFKSNRKTRADRGETSLDINDAKLICQLMDSSRRDNNKRLMSCENAIEILFANQQIQRRYTASSVLRIARMHGFHPEQLARPTPHQNLKSLHPNHVWQVDASICVLFYLPEGGIKTMDRDEFYKNKPQNLIKIRNELCIRYVITDHYSGTIFFKYYVGSGETQEILFDLLVSAFCKKDLHIMHGVPLVLIMDKGAANTAHMVKDFLNKMHVHHYAHSTGNSRAKGSVENAQNIVERGFESLLYYKKIFISTVHELNTYADKWQYNFNARKIHSRTGKTRFDLWHTITTDQLRIAPARAVLETLLTSKPQERTVQGDLSITFKLKNHDHPLTYSVKHIPNINVKDKVLVTVNPYRSPNVDVITVDLQGKETYHECAPREKDDAGFYVDAAVIGQEMKRPANTRADHYQQESLQAQYPNAKNQDDAKKLRKQRVAKFGGNIDPFRHIDDANNNDSNVSYMPKAGTDLEIAVPKQVFEPISVAEACKRIKAVLGDQYPNDTYARLTKKYTEGIDPMQLDSIIDLIRQQPTLKVIGE